MAAPKNNGRQWFKIIRRIVATLLVLILVLIMLLVLGYQLLPVRQLQWSGITISWQQIRLAELSFQAGQSERWWDVRVQQLEIGWRGWPLPFVGAQQLQLMPVITTPAAESATLPAAESATSAEFQLPGWPDITVPGWLPHRLQIPELLLQLPCRAPPQLCQLTGSFGTSRDAGKQNIDLQLQGDGQQVQLQLDLRMQQQKLMQLNIRQLVIRLDLKALADAGWIPGLPPGLLPENIQTQLSGYWQADELQLTLLQPMQVAFSYQAPGAPKAGVQLASARLRFESGQLQCLQIRWQQCQLQLDAAAELQKFQHPLLAASDWQWRGQAQGQLNALKFSGSLQNPQALKVTYQATLSPSALTLQWQLADLFLLAGNPLQIIQLWPQLLELQRGKMSANGELQLQLPGGQLNQLFAQVQLNELYGIYDRTTFGGVTAQVSLEGDPRSFTLKLPELALKQLSHGFQAGPARVAGQYRADWSAPAGGEVRLNQAQMGIFGGQLALEQMQFNLKQPSIEFRLAVQQIQLAELLKQHPSGQLLGEGVMSGIIPLRYQQMPGGDPAQPSAGQKITTASGQALAQWQVAGGSVHAEAPGGRLQYQYRAVPGQKASGMDLAWQALSDFRYQTLASTVELQPDGKVLLQVKLHGFNPKLQQGRPVHFNINVEEDLPALLTSLQLSGKISDLVRQRIQQKIQQQAIDKAKLQPK